MRTNWELTCGCRVVIDETRDLATLYPCGDMHRDLARRLRKPGARWVVAVGGQSPPLELGEAEAAAFRDAEGYGVFHEDDDGPYSGTLAERYSE